MSSLPLFTITDTVDFCILINLLESLLRNVKGIFVAKSYYHFNMKNVCFLSFSCTSIIFSCEHEMAIICHFILKKKIYGDEISMLIFM